MSDRELSDRVKLLREIRELEGEMGLRERAKLLSIIARLEDTAEDWIDLDELRERKTLLVEIFSLQGPLDETEEALWSSIEELRERHALLREIGQMEADDDTATIEELRERHALLREIISEEEDIEHWMTIEELRERAAVLRQISEGEE